MLLLVASFISFFGCKKEKVKGCTDTSSLNYNVKAEEENGTCISIAGIYSVTENCGSIDNFTMSVGANGMDLTISNFANNFNSISASRSGYSITIYPRSNIIDKTGKTWDLNGGSGTISSDGHTLNINYNLDDILYENSVGIINCSAMGVK